MPDDIGDLERDPNLENYPFRVTQKDSFVITVTAVVLGSKKAATSIANDNDSGAGHAHEINRKKVIARRLMPRLLDNRRGLGVPGLRLVLDLLNGLVEI